MCRLMGYVSNSKTSFSEIVGREFEDFVALSSVHCDGWGIATINHDENTVHVDRAPETAVTSEYFEEALQGVSADGALLHLRWATKGLPVNENNTHPFTYKDFTFIHNGAIFPPEAMDEQIDPKFLEMVEGDTDSERYLYFLMTLIEKHGFVEGVKIGVGQIKASMDYSSINAMIMNEESYIVVSEYHADLQPEWAPTDYYELKYRQSGEEVLVASSGWKQEGWKALANHNLLVVNRENLDIHIISL